MYQSTRLRNFVFFVLACLLAGCQSTPEYVSSEALMGTAWEYRDTLQTSSASALFSYGDRLVFNNLDPTFIKLAVSHPPTSLQQLITLGERYQDRSVRYLHSKNNPGQLDVEIWRADSTLSVTRFYHPEELISPDSILKHIGDNLLTVISARGDTLRFRVDQREEDLRVVAISKDSSVYDHGTPRFADLETSDARVTIKYVELGDSAKHYTWVLTGSPGPDTYSLFEILGSHPEENMRNAYAKIEKPSKVTTLSEDEIFHLLSHGTIKVDNMHTYQSGDKVTYEFEDDFMKKGLSIEQLAKIGFSFNTDDTYDIFHQNRSLASGRFRISPDRAYLILTNKRNSQYLKLSYEGADKVTFQRAFQVETPEPLGEKMISSYQLATKVSFSAN